MTFSQVCEILVLLYLDKNISIPLKKYLYLQVAQSTILVTTNSQPGISNEFLLSVLKLAHRIVREGLRVHKVLSQT